jgi:phosphoribosyl-ATP pyrophosphohydrolase
MTKHLARTHNTPDPVPALAATSPAPLNGHSPRVGADHQALRAASGGDSPRADSGELDRLYAALEGITPERSPRTFKLAQSSKRKISQKVIEEAGEVALEAVKHHASGVIRESADLLYHLVVLWHRSGVDPSEVWGEMHARANAFGIAEKLPKAIGRHAAATRTVPSSNR